MIKLKKYENNPVLKPQGDGFEGLCVLNPAVIYDEDEKLFKMLYRAAGNDKQHYIYLGLAESNDGYNFERKFDKPVLAPDINGADGGCVEDPRLVKMGDYYYLTYASRTFAPGQYWREDKEYFGFQPEFGPTMLIYNNSVTHLAISRDLVNWKKLGRITDSRFDDRDVYIFPEKVNGKFVRLSRPMEWCGKGFENEAPAIWISYSSDLMEWEKPRLLMKGNEWWESKKIGGSTPPVKCKYGYMMLYHGVADDGNYRVGKVLWLKKVTGGYIITEHGDDAEDILFDRSVYSIRRDRDEWYLFEGKNNKYRLTELTEDGTFLSNATGRAFALDAGDSLVKADAVILMHDIVSDLQIRKG